SVFSGPQDLVPTRLGKREVVLSQGNLLGLTVTRKVFVPADGYFERRLEELTNPGAADVTVDVTLQAAFDAGRSAGPLGTSSGNPLSTSDTWMVINDADGQNFNQYPVVVVFGSTTPVLPPTSATMSGGVLTLAWSGITVPAGQTVTLMHVLSVQSGRARAEATATRLASAPPELLVGLTAGESQSLLNFQVPTGVNPVPPILLDGVISGQVVGGDGLTPVPSVGGTF